MLPGDQIHTLPTAAGFLTPGRVRITDDHVAVNVGEIRRMDHGRVALWEFLEFASKPTAEALIECVETYGVFGLGRALIDPQEQHPLKACVHVEPVTIWVGLGTVFLHIVRAHEHLACDDEKAAHRSAVKAEAVLDWVIGISEQQRDQRRALALEPLGHVRKSPKFAGIPPQAVVASAVTAAEQVAMAAKPRTVESAREVTASAVARLIKLAGLAPRLRADNFTLEMYSTGSFLLGHMVMELMAVLGGSRTCGLCAGCGKLISMVRRSRTGRKAWCLDKKCKKASRAAASAALRRRRELGQIPRRRRV